MNMNVLLLTVYINCSPHLTYLFAFVRLILCEFICVWVICQLACVCAHVYGMIQNGRCWSCLSSVHFRFANAQIHLVLVISNSYVGVCVTESGNVHDVNMPLCCGIYAFIFNFYLIINNKPMRQIQSFVFQCISIPFLGNAVECKRKWRLTVCLCTMPSLNMEYRYIHANAWMFGKPAERNHQTKISIEFELKSIFGKQNRRFHIYVGCLVCTIQTIRISGERYHLICVTDVHFFYTKHAHRP